MVKWNKNKSELLVLTGAVYTFVAYLTAFTLEILFIIDLAKQNGGFLTLSTGAASTAGSYNSPANQDANQPPTGISAFEQARMLLESMQAHITVSCLAISILYFVLFVASLILIIGLILRSAFLILIWMCIMTTMYLPEFGLIIYISVYSWGLGTRNGQTELIFYLFRAALNIIFIFRAHRLFKDWSYQKNFFMLKSNSRMSGYDSPYFIGDSLTTTINPIFSTSTLHLDRHPKQGHRQPPDLNSSSSGSSISRPTTHKTNAFDEYDIFNYNRLHNSKYAQPFNSPQHRKPRNRHSTLGMLDSADGNFYLASDKDFRTTRTTGRKGSHNDQTGSLTRSSALSFNDQDEYADLEMDLDYRTLTNSQRHHNHSTMNQEPAPAPSSRAELDNYINDSHNYHNRSSSKGGSSSSSGGGGGGGAGLSYSTQSLDRRNLKNLDYSLPEHVILRPLGHQPFEYLRRPGSTSNLNSSSNLNTHSSAYTSTTKLAKGFSGVDSVGSSKVQRRFL